MKVVIVAAYFAIKSMHTNVDMVTCQFKNYKNITHDNLMHRHQKCVPVCVYRWRTTKTQQDVWRIC